MFEEKLNDELVDFNDYVPFPTASTRSFWEELDAVYASKILKEAEKCLESKFETLTASLFMDFCKTGSRVPYEEVYKKNRINLCILVLAECIEYNGRFLSKIIDGIYSICSEISWHLPVHNRYDQNALQILLPDFERPVLDSAAAETAATLSVIRYLLREKFDEECPLICKRISSELYKRVFYPFLNENFYWMAYEENPAVSTTACCIQNILVSAFLPDGSLAAEKLFTKKDKKDLLKKSLHCLDKFFENYADDGCCSDGAMYYQKSVLSFFMSIEILNSIGKECFVSLFLTPKLKNMAEYIVNMHSADKYYFNFADCNNELNFSDSVIYLLGQRCNSEILKNYAVENFLLKKKTSGSDICLSSIMSSSLFSAIQDLYAVVKLDSAEQAGPLNLEDICYESEGLYVLRGGMYGLAVNAGKNNGKHRHNDAGGFILYKGSVPFIIDAGVETYTKESFSENRSSLMSVRSSFHNVTNFISSSIESDAGNAGGVNIIEQKAGNNFGASEVLYTPAGEPTGAVDDWGKPIGSMASLSMELKGAYPETLELESYIRKIDFEKGTCVTVTDTVKGLNGCKSVFTLMTQALPAEIESLQLQPLEPNNTSAFLCVGDIGQITVQSENPLKIKIEAVKLDDALLQKAWGNELYRIQIEFTGQIRALLQ